MNRKEMIQFIRAEICPKLDFSQELDINCILKTVGKFRIRHQIKDEPMQAEVNEYGHLFINGIHAGQITNKISHSNFDEVGYHYESMILAMCD